MSDFRTEIYAANLDFRRYSRGIQGSLVFQVYADFAWNVALTITKGWCADYVINQASGLPEVQIEVADQPGIANIHKEGVLAVVVENVRYERRDQDLMLGTPRIYRFRCQPIGEEAIEVAFSRRANTSYVQ
jgi:hypothetical protein